MPALTPNCAVSACGALLRSFGGLFGVFGVDFAGTVVAIGPGTTRLKVRTPPALYPRRLDVTELRTRRRRGGRRGLLNELNVADSQSFCVIFFFPGSPQIGDNVWGCSKGTYAEYALAFEVITTTSPANIPMDVAGTIPEVAMTSMEALVKMGAPWPK